MDCWGDDGIGVIDMSRSVNNNCILIIVSRISVVYKSCARLQLFGYASSLSRLMSIQQQCNSILYAHKIVHPSTSTLLLLSVYTIYKARSSLSELHQVRLIRLRKCELCTEISTKKLHFIDIGL